MLLPHESPGHNQHELLVASIKTAAEDAYQKVAENTGIPIADVHFQEGPCNDITDSIIDTLASQGHQATRTNRVVWPDRKYGPSGESIAILHQDSTNSLHHSYGVVDVVDGTQEERLVFDATWQQLLSPELRTADLPKVLVGTHEKVTEQARSFGIINPELLKLYAKRREL